MAMNKAEIRTQVKDTVVSQFTEFFPTAVQIDDYTYAIPMGNAEDNGHPIFAKVEVSVPNWYPTKNTPAFDLDAKVEAYREALANRARLAAEKASKKKEKEA